MALTNTIIILPLTLLFIYLTIYKKNRFVGNILFLITGVSITIIDTDLIIYGTIITIASIISLVYDITAEFSKKTKLKSRT